MKERIKEIIFICAVATIVISWSHIFNSILTKSKGKSEEVQVAEIEEAEVYGSYIPHIIKQMDSWEVPSDFQAIDCDIAEDVQEFAFLLCKENSIDFRFVMAVMQHESGFDASAISKTNDYGLFQINICNHGWLSETLGITDFLDPYQNIEAGVYILRSLFEKYDGDPNRVLMSYHMGEGGASKLWNQGIYETSYSLAVMEIIEEMGEAQ